MGKYVEMVPRRIWNEIIDVLNNAICNYKEIIHRSEELELSDSYIAICRQSIDSLTESYKTAISIITELDADFVIVPEEEVWHKVLTTLNVTIKNSAVLSEFYDKITSVLLKNVISDLMNIRLIAHQAIDDEEIIHFLY